MKASYSLLLTILISGIVFIRCTPAADHEHPHEHEEEHADASKEFYELKVYHVSSPEQKTLVENYLCNAAIPAMNRLGIETVGTFTPVEAENGEDKIYVLTSFSSLDQFASLQDKMMADPTFQQAGAEYLDIAHPDKAYERLESRLLVAFDSMPAMEVPSLTATHPDRLFELRSYESYSEKKGLAKVRMFDAGGEVAIFKKLGFEPVFFSRALTGSEQPNLVYMVTYPDTTSQRELWNEFRSDPDWAAIKDLPEYANTVSKIHSHMLKPLACSQI